MFSLQNKGCIGFRVTKNSYSAELRITLISNIADDVSDAIENCVIQIHRLYMGEKV